VSIQALFLDFDGTLWDSEVAGFDSWSEIYEEHDLEFPIEVYATRLGTVGGLDPIAELERRVGRPLDRAAIAGRHRTRKLELLAGLGPRPGVEDYLREARHAGLALGVVSTDDLDWIMSGLRHLGLEGRWDLIECADGDPTRAKPSPVLYRSALDTLSLDPREAVAIEDSPNGILAAKRAGLFCLAVSHAVSERLDLSQADAVTSSLAELPLLDLLRLADAR
jgi:HAD superfamily hydrolase (TIGR01509 family)